ncbi:glioma pathogenesis-related protein 1 isoform X1 [Hippopotamus amphibius kiboko]|uniref:glioma pathogenesis-related protein 1 isoform X1 n=1 Tax=Hippopotamus amphibius kiboko TaxID=575201 RepID=UPI002594BC91|nr:glioma pathogenesis-related protein 1 isoform X1 [Hippopotamus amphibius kiboko]XP_057597244.1 glioma pathogenesis-related protein 1 isoform X1 [Hippopotamus amphibius kiboko]XP_057597245.1 glioma pathogenesis-related protein 1 isoform X1 [Hippopotamus amphibius kiboko]XP_057597246.1 glioma pathogenesis-related protein 1 isoform X1 [Hippopotamus amphibius kiboko]XP_057597247.1 glioma pathogenesis-related protein 1 isoform X1 [Hippopotamus amphibius kiboko]XP_057597248.1 glioma pathogenesis-
MRVTLAVTACMLSVVSSVSYSADTLPDIENEGFIKECVRMHNKFRSGVTPTASDMLYMTWDPVLARIAKAWARNCQFAHNVRLKPPHKLHPNFTSLGENLWTGSLSIFSVSSAITDWYEEVQYYNFKTRKCDKVCGHYTQVVWADSYKVGCAVQFCPRVSGFESLGSGAHFICNYAPAGNYPTWPYKKGSTCSACPSHDNCLDNLCVNPQRDKVTRYYSAVFPDWPIFPRNRYISLFLIVTPPILILTVIIIILVKHKYPHLLPLN